MERTLLTTYRRTNPCKIHLAELDIHGTNYAYQWRRVGWAREARAPLTELMPLTSEAERAWYEA